MNRRSVIRLLAASCSSIAVFTGVRAQGKAPFRIAWVSLDQANAKSPLLLAFRAGLAELGYVEGQNLRIDTWWGEGSIERLEAMRPDVLRSQPDVIVAQGGIALTPMLHASVDRAVLFSMSADPVEAGIVKSYARPGGNVTGITLFAAQLAGKRLDLLKQLVPGLKLVGVVSNPAHPGAQQELQAAQESARSLGLSVRHFPAANVDKLDDALKDIGAAKVGAVLVFSDGVALGYADRLVNFSWRQRIPVAAGWAPFAQRGLLLSYGPEFADVYRRLASYADRIRKGALPGDLPIEQPTKFELVINLKTAQVIGIQVPQSLLLQAAEVVR
jgi:putative ABC transport system substrate-binding protein